MKQEYKAPITECYDIKFVHSLLSASDSGSLPSEIYDDETAGGNESLSRRNYSVWDDEADDNEEMD